MCLRMMVKMWYTNDMFDVDIETLLKGVEGQRKRKMPDLSVAVMYHVGEFITHKTILSVLLGLKDVIAAGRSCELIIHVDGGDASRYFDRYRDRENVKLWRNDFGDVGKSRNYVVSMASGKNVAFINAGDLISRDYYLGALELLGRSNEEIVTHANAEVSFGVCCPAVVKMESESEIRREDVSRLARNDAWDSAMVASRELLMKYPYREGDDGRLFNIDVLDGGVSHKIVEGAVTFCRKPMDYKFDETAFGYEVMPYMDLFSVSRLREDNSREGGVLVAKDDMVSRLKQNKFYRKMRENKLINYFVTPVANVFVKRKIEMARMIPSFVVDKWKQMNVVETQLYPHDWVLDDAVVVDKNDDAVVGARFVELLGQVRRRPDYVFIVPWLIRGGGDKVVINYIEALRKIRPEWYFAVIATEAGSNNEWADKLPDNVDFVEFGKAVGGLLEVDKDRIMSLLITQLGCRRIHVVNSMFGYLWTMRHKGLIESKYDMRVSLFNPEPVPGKGVFSYDDPYLRDIVDVVSGVYTDNEAMIKYMMDFDGFEDDGKFKVHYQPVRDMKLRSAKEDFVEEGKLRILWAGRLVQVKMPEMVAEIGKRLDPEKFTIDVYGEFGNDVSRHVFDGVSNVKYCGEFDGFDTLPTEKYDMLLYTSRSDGVPNIILEATMAGLPIIASNDGGVGEVIKDGETGILVKDFLKPDEYVEKLKQVDSIDTLRKYVKNAQKLVKTRHSWEKFLKDVKRDLVD